MDDGFLATHLNHFTSLRLVPASIVIAISIIAVTLNIELLLECPVDPELYPWRSVAVVSSRGQRGVNMDVVIEQWSTLTTLVAVIHATFSASGAHALRMQLY